jgi:hypothetical protein
MSLVTATQQSSSLAVRPRASLTQRGHEGGETSR